MIIGIIFGVIFATLLFYLLWKVIERNFSRPDGKPDVVTLKRCKYTALSHKDFIDMWSKLVEEYSKKGFVFKEHVNCCPAGYKGDINRKAPIEEHHSITCNGTKYVGDFSEEKIREFLDIFYPKEIEFKM
uniref:Uncharacterized protein n=1 Tax=Marseillevirus LCMAC101 TaxID=2506602 RepID=A0A481YS90_9VIRU|nr:MAG: hypothetical protein LCMAC101_04150 [Marseillevirus LCMAC101]